MAEEQATSGLEAAEGSVVQELTDRTIRALQHAVSEETSESEAAYQELLDQLSTLFMHKKELTSVKAETVDLLRDLIQASFRRGFKAVRRRDSDDPENLLAFLMGTTFTVRAMGELASGVDRILMEQSQPQEYTFAGNGDFIAVEEVMQLLATGQHTGVLVVEKPDNCVQLFFKDGLVAFVDPQRLTRRVLRGVGLREYREITLDLAREAEDKLAREGRPLFLHFLETGFFAEEEFRSFLLAQGNEVTFEFIRDSADCRYRWNKLETLPDHVERWNMGMAVLPILLEAHKQMDDWRMVRRIIPNNNVPIIPAEDRFAKMAELAMDASQIKLLAMVNGDNTVRQMADIAGLPTFEVAGMLAEFAKMGIIEPPGGPESLLDQPQNAQESMEWALAALDANEELDALQVQDGVEDVFDAMEPGDGPPASEGEDEGLEDSSFSLKFMRAARRSPRRWRSRSRRR